jgi:hypothetical protein
MAVKTGRKANAESGRADRDVAVDVAAAVPIVQKAIARKGAALHKMNAADENAVPTAVMQNVLLARRQ